MALIGGNASGVSMGNSVGLKGQQATAPNATLQALQNSQAWMFPNVTGPDDHGVLAGPSAAQQTGWTGVSTNADPYGVANIGTPPGGSFAGFNGAQLLAMNQPQVTPPTTAGAQTAGGYANSPQTPTTAPANPYAAQATTDASTIANQTANAQGNVTSAQNQMAGASSYPAFPNSYGLGGATAPAPAASPAAQGSYSPGGVTLNVPDTSSRGMSPWSMQGESNSRDTSSGVMNSGPQPGL